MRRRDVLKLSAAAAMLAMPHIARAQRERTLKFVPGGDLSLLDPVWTLARTTRLHAHLVFDTLYGLDATFTARPQMVEGHTVENDGKRLDVAPARGLAISRRHTGARARRGREHPAFRRPRRVRSVADRRHQRTLRAGLPHLTIPPEQTFPASARRAGRLIMAHAVHHAGSPRQHRPFPPGDGDGR